MEIVWNPNPLETQIFLNDTEKLALKLQIKIEEMEYLFTGAELCLSRNDLEGLKKEIDTDYVYNGRLDKRAEDLLEHYVRNLESITHMGDCTCFPSSCIKCHAEDSLVTLKILEKYTIDGLGKHGGHKLFGFFEKYKDIEKVLDHLSNYEKHLLENPPTWSGWEAHVPRWNKEAQQAHQWLSDYGRKHGFV